MDGPAAKSEAARWVLWGVVPLAVGATGLFKVSDPDVWWRVRTGEWIWTHHALPHTDPFSHTAAGPWQSVEPLGNLFLFGFHAAAGPMGLAWAGAVMALLVGLAVAALARAAIEEGPALGPSLFAVGLFVACANFRFGPKPEMFSLAGLAALLLLLHSAERSRQLRRLVVVPLLVLVWTWLHRGSVLALPVVGAAALTWVAKRETRLLGGAAALALLASLGALWLAPGTGASLETSAAVVSTPVYVAHLPEWRPLSWAAVWAVMPFLPLLVIAWAAVAPVQRRLHFGTLVVLGMGAIAVRHVRFAPLFALAMVPEVTWGLSRQLQHRRAAIARHVRPLVLGGLLAALGGGAALLPYLNRPVSTWGPGLHHFRRPVEAARFLADHPPPGRMFNSFNYGSYLLYALAPGQKVFIDGRNDQVYSPAFFARVSLAPRDDRVLERLIESYGVSYAVLECTQLVAEDYAWLYRNPRWSLVYLDDQAAILVEQTPASRAYLEQHAYHELNPRTALQRLQAARPDPHWSELAREVLRNVRESPRSVRARYLATLVYRRTGPAEAFERERAKAAELAAERGLAIDLP